jgi:hypothetical protein
MGIGKFLAMVAIKGVANLMSKTTLEWATVNEWIAHHANSDDIGRGFFEGRLSPSMAGHAEIHKARNSQGKIEVTARVIFNARDGATFKQSWVADKLDSKLEKRFGDNLRFTIKL